MTHYPIFTSLQLGSSCFGIASGGHQLQNDAEFATGTQKLQTVVYGDFLDPFLPCRLQKKYFQVSEYEQKIRYCTQTHHTDASIGVY